MRKKIFYMTSLLALAGFILQGCTTTDVKVKSYVTDMPRVDQDRSGNAGYLLGRPLEERLETKSTRRIYVLEFDKQSKEKDLKSKKEIKPEQGVEKIPPEELTQRNVPSTQATVEEVSASEVNTFEDTNQFQQSSATVSFTEYVVQKDDTLQKIAQKFYGSYSQWTKIYEVNKDKINDPNKVKEGTTLKIPVESFEKKENKE